MSSKQVSNLNILDKSGNLHEFEVADETARKVMEGAVGESISGTVHIGEHDYPYRKIGNQVWLTENLKEDLTDSVWYDNDQDTHEPLKHGKLYTWESLCKSDGSASDELAAILPEGWRVPTIDEWRELLEFADPERTYILNQAAYALKSTEQWEDASYNLDTYGMSILPTGEYQGYFAFPPVTYFWSSTKYNEINAYHVWIRPYTTYIETAGYSVIGQDGDRKYSVRLIADSSATSKDGKQGQVPAPSKTNVNDTLHGDGTWRKSKTSELINDSGLTDKSYVNKAVSGIGYKSSLIDQDTGYTIDLGNRIYKLVKIGNQLWFAENLEYVFDSLVIGSTDTDLSNKSCAWYLNNDEFGTNLNSERRVGLLYNYNATQALIGGALHELYGTSWRIPTKSDFDSLVTKATSAGTSAFSSLSATTKWAVQSNNELGFSAVPTGIYSISGKSFNNDSTQYMWTATDHEYAINNKFCFFIAPNYVSYIPMSISNDAGVLRLVLDLNSDGSLPTGCKVRKGKFVDALTGPRMAVTYDSTNEEVTITLS